MTTPKAYYEIREEIGQRNNVGYTELYNNFHDPELVDADICAFREMQIDLDRAVLRAYGWGDLDLCHGFHQPRYLPENDRVRFTISEDARHQVLRRLADLNQQRSFNEATKIASLEHVKKKRRRRSKNDSLILTNDLFGGEDA